MDLHIMDNLSTTITYIVAFNNFKEPFKDFSMDIGANNCKIMVKMVDISMTDFSNKNFFIKIKVNLKYFITIAIVLIKNHLLQNQQKLTPQLILNN